MSKKMVLAWGKRIDGLSSNQILDLKKMLMYNSSGYAKGFYIWRQDFSDPISMSSVLDWIRKNVDCFTAFVSEDAVAVARTREHLTELEREF